MSLHHQMKAPAGLRMARRLFSRAPAAATLFFAEELHTVGRGEDEAAGDFRVIADSCSPRSLDFADRFSVTLELGSDGTALHQVPLRGGIFVNGYQETIKTSPIATELELGLGLRAGNSRR